MTIEEANRLLIAALTGLYDEREAASICSLVMERVTGMQKGLRLLHKKDLLPGHQEFLFQRFLEDLLKNRPVQYVLGEAWFGALPFYVDESVLIPRPETEELADWLLHDYSEQAGSLSVLDIGTGSGCIPVYLYKKRMDFKLIALDVSEAALNIAKKNASFHKATVDFLLIDIRDPGQWENIPQIDLIISNPPYIPEKQKEVLEKHVKDYEPSLALFVPDKDPILFYKIIGECAMQILKRTGTIFLEIHHDYAKDIVDWYQTNGFILELKKDLSGNNRMIKVWRA